MKAFWYNENRKNICGIRIRELRKQQRLTQKQLAIKAQLAGYDFITETAIIKLELGTRFIPDYEVSIFAEILGTTPDDLLQNAKFEAPKNN
ncbi:MAG: helix-turn-helix transcriptional regulator [Lachnospiraceae bacterium]|nr:helix-turn-helix transcriptional regulator [Lachnospiraceae bacterium]